VRKCHYEVLLGTDIAERTRSNIACRGQAFGEKKLEESLSLLGDFLFELCLSLKPGLTWTWLVSLAADVFGEGLRRPRDATRVAVDDFG
jgi:hypothetical protein